MNCRYQSILRTTLLTLRKNVGHFTSRCVHLKSSMEYVCDHTMRHHISKLGFYYLRSMKKSLLSEKNVKLKKKFCGKDTRRRLGQKFWRHDIRLYGVCL